MSNCTSSFHLCLLTFLFCYSYSGEIPAQELGAAEIYHQYCSVCHGDRGDGRSRARQGLVPPPRDFTAPDTIASLGRERMIRSVLDGRPGTAMTGWRTRLTDQQAAAVVDYIRTRFMQIGATPADAPAQAKNSAAAASIPAAASRHAPRGDFDRGKLLYAANCATCHGLDGNGNGPRAYFIFPKPRNFVAQDTRRRLDRQRLLRAVSDGVAGREMPAWRHVLTDSQIADVSEYVYRAFLRPDGESPD